MGWLQFKHDFDKHALARAQMGMTLLKFALRFRSGAVRGRNFPKIALASRSQNVHHSVEFSGEVASE